MVNDLIKVNYDTEQPTVSARELYKTLEISKRFSAWFETNSQGFIENQDFTEQIPCFDDSNCKRLRHEC